MYFCRWLIIGLTAISLTLSLPGCLMEFCKVTLAFESVDEILWCDHSNESSLPVLSHDAICFSQFWKMKFGNLVETCLWPHLAVKGLINYIRWSSRLKLPFSEQTLLIMSLWRIGRFCFQMFQQPFVGNKPKAIGLVHLPGKKTHLRTRRNNMKMQVLNRIKWRPVIAT